ncbi:hypothetical protein L9G15_09555 [Shewanella sp. A3A]|nr:hypothetical protein [Shewanella ferrihydritica]
MKTGCLLPFIACCWVGYSYAAETAIYVDWESKYISEGRNNLPSGGVIWSGIDYQNGSVLLFERQGVASSENYVEFNGGIGYQLQFDDWQLIGSYTRLEFFGDERCYDNELAAALEYQAWQWLTPSLVYTHATAANGGFLEFTLAGHWPLNDSLELSPYVTQGWDFGFATADYDGRNNLQFGLIGELQLNPQLALSLHLSRSIAQQDIKHEQGDQCQTQQTFGGVMFSYQF